MEKSSFRKSIYFLVTVLLIAVCLLIFWSSYSKSKSLRNKTMSDISSSEKQSESVLKISLSDKVKKLPLYGFNGNNIKGPSWANKSFRDSASSLQLKIIRYPGGTNANWWDWQKGWFANDADLPQEFKNIPYSPTGLKELKLLVDETECDIVFVLNMVTKDLTDQIQMLKYAQSLGIPIKWIELGNEFYLQNSIGLRKYKTVKGYAQACYEWINNIKSVFPKVKIAVIGGNREYSNDVKNWNKQVLQYAPNADAIIAHVYAKFFKVTDENGINFQNLSEEFRKQYESIGFPFIDKKIPIWITEYNIQWVAGKPNEENKKLKEFAFSWGQALATLLMTSLATNFSDKVEMILDHNISNTSVFAAIETGKRTFQKLPNGIGMGSWLSASNHMDSLTKINFFNNNNPLNDYELLGWKFYNREKSSFIFVNFINTRVKVNISPVINGNASFETKYAEKNAVINSATDVKYKNDVINNSVIELPPYSVTIIKTSR